MNRQILHGDVLEKIQEIPAESIDCIITSPPFWGLRDYQVDNQIGLEPDFRDYLKTMHRIMGQCKRILKPSGSCWVNLGDSYSNNNSSYTKGRQGLGHDKEGMRDNRQAGITEKSRIGIPERFYANCIDDGWISRNHIPWVKSNPMPSSVKDRFTNKWESLFFFTKQPRYYFDLNAVRVKSQDSTRPASLRSAGIGGQTKLSDIPEKTKKHKQDNVLGADGKPKPTYKGFNQRWKNKHDNVPGQTRQSISTHSSCYNTDTGECTNHPNGKNPGDVFFINSKPFIGAHFATFPIDLPLKILKCACPNETCKSCGEPRYPIIESIQTDKITESMKKAGCNNDGTYTGEATKNYKSARAQNASDTKRRILQSMQKETRVIGHTKCSCNAGFQPGIVLDPFFGAGTVAVAAEHLGLQWTGIELNQEYIDIARKRLAPLMNEHLEVQA